ncbi:DUF1294 domain-containing protein [Sphingomonas sp.]|uniref:DUF1294 domain-containing protein n=1 Tax=Sphingomonas sp. TaxID=28214 RepID=UPI002DD6B983|nr:DUF1294 domain-containing protein [Sphingomonas sp.]
MILIAAFVLLGINVVTFMTFGDDKARAINGLRRVRESDLLGLALIGGSPAAFLARRHFRHKTRKQPFSTWLALIAIIQGGAVTGIGWSLAERALQA